MFGVALLLVATAVYGWNGTGHMVIAATAYHQLPAASRARLAEILKHHPDYSRWRAEAPDALPNDDEGLYLFMRASTWADEIRARVADGHPDAARYQSMQGWHFITIPLSKQGPGAIPASEATILAGIDQSTTRFATQRQALQIERLIWHS